MYRMIPLFSLLLIVACVPEVLPEQPLAVPNPTEAPVSVTPEEVAEFDDRLTAPTMADSTLFDKLGINFTWAADGRITGDPYYAGTTFRHVRFFQMMEKDYVGGTPSGGPLELCDNLQNPWACPENSMRQHLLRVLNLRKMFPRGSIWIAPEVIGGKGWPCKGFTAQEMGTDIEGAGYQWGRVALATYGPVGGVILAMTNEEWCQEPGRTEAYNEWRRGVIRAHRENPSCELALGATAVRERTWQGERLPDNVCDVATDIWAYLDEVGGWADIHTHVMDENLVFYPHETALTSPEYLDFFDWSRWVSTRYPNIRKAVGEVAYTTSEPDVVATPEQKLADWPTYRKLIEGLATEADIVFLYQIEDHDYPEGAFSGSGVFPTLKANVQVLGREPAGAVGN